jgi:ribose transport system permease protein
LTLRWPVPGGVAVALVLGLGACAGAVAGALVARLKMPPFIVTLALLVFARGLAKQLSGGQKVSSYVQTADGRFVNVPVPDIYAAIDTRVFGGQLSVVTLVFAGCSLLTGVVLARHKLGRYLLAIGGNAEAARLSGVPVRAALTFAYAMSGLFAATAGICQAAQEAQGDPETGMGYELDAIAMVVLGGTRLAGGQGSVGLTLIGVLSLGYLQKVLSLNALSSELRLMLTGAILLVALFFQQRYRSARP